jgi:glycosyltransferase involved in cell wall biosynthesis
MAVVPNPIRTSGFRRVPDDEIRSFRRHHGIGEAELLLGRIGQFYDRKWSPLLIDAFEHVRKAGLAAKLVVVNAPQTILARCKASPYWSDVIVIDEIIGDESMSLAYSAIDVFVHVADQGESFGIVLTESMLCETPCVVMSTPWEDNSQPDVVGNMVGGLVATSRRGFYDALMRLCRDQPLRRRLGSQGRNRVLERFDSQAVARDALECIRQQPTAGMPASTADVLTMYRDAIDIPSWLTLACVPRFRRLQLTRYTTGYEPWSRFFVKCVQVAGRRLGLWAGPSGDSPV